MMVMLMTMMMMMMMMMKVNCFCGMVVDKRHLALFSFGANFQRFSPSAISETPGAKFEPAQNMSSDFFEESCAVLITTKPWHHINMNVVIIIIFISSSAMSSFTVYVTLSLIFKYSARGDSLSQEKSRDYRDFLFNRQLVF